MSTAEVFDQTLITRVEQFYYREARLLDERCFQQWLGLLDPMIQYVMPSRHVEMGDAKARGAEGFLAVDRELEWTGSDESPIRCEGFEFLAARALRGFKPNAWAESPPPRTRRMIANVEVEPREDGTLRALSNFHLFYSHHGADNHHYVGCRRDVLKESEGSFRILRREVILDWNVITGPTLALTF